MKCIKPKPVLILFNEELNKNQIKFLNWNEYKVNLMHQYDKFIQWLACGQCQSCLLNRAKEWMVRNYCESLEHENKYFLTITYNEENVKNLNKDDMQRFIKRLRKNQKNPIRFFGSGEIGTKTKRAHYHYIFYGLEINDLKFYKFNDLKQPYFTSEKINKTWGMGYVVIGKFEAEVGGYIARYTAKKNGIANPDEFLNMSNRKGIGENWALKNLDKIAADKILIKTTKKNFYASSPRYFTKILERENKNLFEQLKEKRKSTAKNYNNLFWSDEDRTFLQLQNDNKILLKNTLKKINRLK